MPSNDVDEKAISVPPSATAGLTVQKINGLRHGEMSGGKEFRRGIIEPA